jgi:Ricin-type beta-trefoil lectin domain-like
MEGRQLLSGYYISNESGGMVLDNPAGTERSGTQMIQWQWHGGANQQWTLLAAGDGPAVTYHVWNAANGDLLGDHQ